MIRRVLLLLMMFWPLGAQATPLIADLSNYRISIDSSFNGTRLFLFGARNDNGDIVVVIRGPHKDYMVRKKERVAGIWMNTERMKFYRVPDFYAMASSKPLDEIEQANIFRQLRIGQFSLLDAPTDPQLSSSYEQFADAFFRHQYERRLYMQHPSMLNFMAETLFKTVIEFPDDIPSGDYSAEIYLISDGEIVGMQSTPIKVVKTGLDAFLYNYAHNHPAFYGITAVVLALAAGWMAGRMFEKI